MQINEISHEDALAFILGGKAQFTVSTDEPKNKSLDHISLRVNKNDKVFPWYWTVWYGNERIARITLKSTGYVVEVIRQQCITDMHRVAAETVVYLIGSLQAGSTHNKVHIFHHGLCSVCSRPLTDPESIRTGIGPVCKKRTS